MFAFLNGGMNNSCSSIVLDIYGYKAELRSTSAPFLEGLAEDFTFFRRDLQLIRRSLVFHLSLGRDSMENARVVHETIAQAAGQRKLE